jgi:hypothetical protein
VTDISRKASDLAKKPRRSLTNALIGLFILDPKHPDGGYRDDGSYIDHEYTWSEAGMDDLRRRLERGG